MRSLSSKGAEKRVSQGRSRGVRGSHVFALCALAVAFHACGSSDDNDDDNPKGGSAGVAGGGGRAGVAGRAGGGGVPPTGGAAGSGGSTDEGGSAGQGGDGAGAGAGTGGAVDAGAGGTPDGAGAGGVPSTAGVGGAPGGAGGTPEPPPVAGAGGQGGAGGSQFSCDDLEPLGGAGGVSSRLCYDFDDLSEDDDWTPEGGQWMATNGAYVGIGPATPVNCPVDAGSYMTASLLDGFSATNVRMHVQMTGSSGLDKVLVLRARDGANRIELNFRSNFGSLGESGGDLTVQEIVDCVYTDPVPPDTIAIPHAVNDVLDVDLELRGRQLQVWIGGTSVFDAEVPGISTEAGAVGFGVFLNGTIRFDNFIVESLD